ncbi:hypothetical protein [Asanoa siamensis]|uniref:Uncharacterized protein n=1 Tax=Asanoa siamensis TaxID=926357 RepID=A0ABQ4D3Z7_9ACTN|nr:hypothetical protein [Asanoa siamensis]GIF78268.1 hypothetical protein Asi02nite_77860 [Asanoa siamensis]
MRMDERIREALVEIAEEVRPAPDPFGRLRLRRRRVRRRRVAVAGVGLALAAAVGVTVPLLPDRADRSVSDSQLPGDIHQWAERLRKSPIRGKVGASDPAFVAEFARLVADRQRAGKFRVTASVTEVNVLFLDDIGSARVALVAFHLAMPDHSGWENASAWFAARPGASAAELASPRATAGIGDGLDPFSVESGLSAANGAANAAVGLVPAGCVVETAPLPALDQWTPEPTGSYVIRTRATERAEWWRAVCDGVVKEMRPADAFPPRSAVVTDAQLDEALMRARGQVNRDKARDAVSDPLSQPNLMAGPARVLWGGQVADTKPDASGPYNGEAVLTAWPQAHSGWTLQISIWPNPTAPGGAISTGAMHWMPNDPTEPNIALPIRLGESVSVLVIVPDGATTVRAARDGALVDAADVKGLSAVVNAPDGPTLVFEALDRDGRIVATAKLPTNPPSDPDVIPW